MEDTDKITVDSKKFLQLKHDIQRKCREMAEELIEELLGAIDITINNE